MSRNRNLAAALIPVAMVPIVIGTASRDRLGEAFGLSGDFWSGTLLGVGIGLLFISIVIGARAARSR